MPADIPITPEMVEAALDAQRGHRGWRYNEADAKRREMRAALSAALAASALPQAVAALEALMTPSQWPGDAVDAARAALAALREAGWSVTAPEPGEDWHDKVDPDVCHCGRDAECHWKWCPAKDGKCPLPWAWEPRDA